MDKALYKSTGLLYVAGLTVQLVLHGFDNFIVTSDVTKTNFNDF